MPMELRSLGIDLSTVATGLVLLREHSPQPLVEMETEIKRPKLTGWEQKAAIVQAVLEALRVRAARRARLPARTGAGVETPVRSPFPRLR